MKKDEYISAVTSLIEDKVSRAEVKNELETHLEDRTAFYTNAGFDEKTATNKAIERMGNPEDVAQSLSEVHNNELYGKLAYVFTIIYALGIMLGATLTVLFSLDTLDLNYYASTVCVLSVIVFLCASLAHYFINKTHSEAQLTVFGVVSFIHIFTAPLTFLPCGFSILSLFFQFPYDIIENGSFDFFYYPFESTVLDFFNTSGIDEPFYYILWVTMCAFGLLPIVSGILCIISLSKINSEDIEIRRFFGKTKKYASFLLVAAIFGVIAVTTEVAVNSATIFSANKAAESRYAIDFNEGWKRFENIDIPLSTEEAIAIAEENGQPVSESDAELGLITCYENYWCSVILYDSSWDGEAKAEGNQAFCSKRFLNHCDGEASEEDLDKLRNLKPGSTEDDIWDIVSLLDIDSYEISTDRKTTHTFICFSNSETEAGVNLELKDGVLETASADDDGEE